MQRNDWPPLEFPEFKLHFINRQRKSTVKAIVVFDQRNNLTINAVKEIALDQALSLYHQCHSKKDIDVIELVQLSKIEGWCVIVKSRI